MFDTSVSAKPAPDYSTVADVYAGTGSVRATARQLGISRHRVCRILSQVPGGSGGGGSRVSKLDPFKGLLDELMGRGVFNTRRLLEECRLAGYRGSEWLIKEYVRPFRPARQRTSGPVRRYETGPGKVAQMDWGYCDFVTPAGVRKIAVFAMILGYSRMRYVEFASKCELENLTGAMVRAFDFFGGVPAEVLTDRMRTVVVESRGAHVVFNPRFEAFAKDLGFIPRVCLPRRPQTKGKVERTVRLVKDQFVPNRVVADLVDLNEQALAWIREVNSRAHASTGRVPLEMLSEENLAPLHAGAWVYTAVSRQVSREGFVSFEGFNYGVNWRHAGKTVHVVRDNSTGLVRILIPGTGEILAEHHQAGPGSARYLYANDQYEGMPAPRGLRPWRTGQGAIHLQARSLPPAQQIGTPIVWDTSQWDMDYGQGW